MPVAERVEDVFLGQLARQNMRTDVPERHLVGVEHHLAEHRVAVGVVRRHGREWVLLDLLVIASQKIGQVARTCREDFVRISLLAGFEFAELPRIGDGPLQVLGEFSLHLRVRVPVVDLHPGIPFAGGILRNLLNVREELQIAIGVWISKLMIVFRTGDEQHPFTPPAPSLGLRTAMVGPHNDVNTGFFGRLQDLFARAQRVWRIFRVDMQDGAKVAVNAGERLRHAVARPFQPRLPDLLEMVFIQPFDGRQRSRRCGGKTHQRAGQGQPPCLDHASWFLLLGRRRNFV